MHSTPIIDQAISAMKVLTLAVARQFFGCFLTMHTIQDWWLITGISTFFSLLYMRKLTGNNEFKHTVYADMKEICQFEKDQGAIILDLNYSQLTKETNMTAKAYRCHMIGSYAFLKMAEKKAHLVFRLIDDAIGRDVTLQLLKVLLFN